MRNRKNYWTEQRLDGKWVSMGESFLKGRPGRIIEGNSCTNVPYPAKG